ncbi:MAG: hypothetical protein QHC90_23980 [Shinella sp.]|nr:hypothetical protein [Shinella sp.]
MRPKKELIAIVLALIVIGACAWFLIPVQDRTSTGSTRVEDTRVGADGPNETDENPPSAEGDAENPS